MRNFSYYLFDNFTAEEAAAFQDNPRCHLNCEVDAVLAAIAEEAPGGCGYSPLCRRFSKEQIDTLIRIGLLRKEGEAIFLDSTVILEEDTTVFTTALACGVERMAEHLAQKKREMYHLADELQNGFAPQTNLYHLLCGQVLDGEFFDCLAEENLVSTSRQHPSGLDYIITIYENCDRLNRFSDGLLCSYNRYTDGKRALQSFGDSDGSRMDFFRFSWQKAAGKVPASLSFIEADWDSIPEECRKKEILDEVQHLADTGVCKSGVLRLLEDFGYAQNGKISVPVYRENTVSIVKRMTEIVRACIFEDMRKLLVSPNVLSGFFCQKHHTSTPELANEVYHVIFGLLNEALVVRGVVEAPAYRKGEGRYLQSIELM